MARGPLIILSGPSGAGKTLAIAHLLAHGKLRLQQSISVTTRPKRDDEQDGVHYYFWTRERFQEEVKRDGFLEWAEVHENFYGTPKASVEALRNQGIGVVLVIDVQGAAQVRSRCPESVSIFMRTSTWELLEKRLRGRGTESEEKIQLRLANARKELEQSGEYQYQVINDDLESCVAQLCKLIEEAFVRSESNA